MPDTIRTTSALLALAPDNTTGEISPQDLRDFMVSAFNRLDDSLAKKTDATSTFQNSAASGTTLSVRSNSSGQYGILSALGSSGSGVTLQANNTSSLMTSALALVIATSNSSAARDITISTNEITVSNAACGDINLTAGTAQTLGAEDSNGGNITITAGGSATYDGLGTGYGAGGNITITAGVSGGEFAPVGGSITITGGQGSDGAGGNNGSAGGPVAITAGSSSSSGANGGTLTLGGGNAVGFATDGAYMTLSGGSSTPGEANIHSPGNCSFQVGGLGIILNSLTVGFNYTGTIDIGSVIDMIAVTDISGTPYGFIPVYSGA